MKILFAGGGSGGHFTPIIAVARQLRKIAEDEKFVSLEMVFVADKPFEKDTLDLEGIRYVELQSGKRRNYWSPLNILDLFRTAKAVFKGLWLIYTELPDVIFSKGGFAAFPVLFAARMYNIPLIIHDSDSVPGKVTKWSAKFADRIAVSFEDATAFFPPEKTAYTGSPVRSQLLGGNPDEAVQMFHLETHAPLLFIMGGSQGAQSINDAVLQLLPTLVDSLQIIHQCGDNNYADTAGQASVLLSSSPNKNRYHVFGHMNEDELRNASRMADLIVSRAGGNTIFEIAAWGIPSILIPLPSAAQDHQRKNAYAYARTGACEVIEETNLTPSVLLGEITRLLTNTEKRQQMKVAAQKFARLDASDNIAHEILKLGMHEGE